MSKESKNNFIYKKIFPDASSILGRIGKSQDEILKTAIFILDTNSLLVPYNTGKENIEEIKEVYLKLINKNRLFIPEHVLREFAKNRSLKISNLYTHIDNHLSSIPSVKPFEYPILGELDAYKKLSKSRKLILDNIKKYKENLKELKTGITDWNWSDPVTSMYQNTFNSEMIISLNQTEEELISEYDERIENQIPPGNKDKLKDDNAIGDFLIWKSILELGKKESKDIVFVSNDEKNDWLLKGNKKSISTKFELVDEFYRITEGKHFISINFSNFLEKQGLEIDFINEGFNPYEEVYLSDFKIKKTDTLNALTNIERIIQINFFDENPYLEGDINEYINAFNKSYSPEFFGKPEWALFFDDFYLFEEWLTEIKELNDEIIHQENRMKRDTRTEKLKLDFLCKTFIKKYSKFKKKLAINAL